ncbi:hypothetical protein C7475_12014 [Chitinophaga sp. S165]|nr:hypothetical protein C7475_12014 [Chitinophaga sp. S165]
MNVVNTLAKLLNPNLPEVNTVLMAKDFFVTREAL